MTERLLELALPTAQANHWSSVSDKHGIEFRSGHTAFDFEDCEHPDCVLVRGGSAPAQAISVCPSCLQTTCSCGRFVRTNRQDATPTTEPVAGGRPQPEALRAAFIAGWEAHVRGGRGEQARSAAADSYVAAAALPSAPLCSCGTTLVCPDIGCDHNKFARPPGPSAVPLDLTPEEQHRFGMIRSRHRTGMEEAANGNPLLAFAKGVVGSTEVGFLIELIERLRARHGNVAPQEQ